MKKIWWPVGACLLLIMIIMVIMHAYRHDTSTDTAGYGSPGAPAMGREGAPPDDSQAGPSYPIVRNRPLPPAYSYGGQAPSPGGQPSEGVRPGGHYGAAAPRPQHPEGMAPNDAPQPDNPSDDQMGSAQIPDQPPDQDYQDGNPEEIPPQEGIDE